MIFARRNGHRRSDERGERGGEGEREVEGEREREMEEGVYGGEASLTFESSHARSGRALACRRLSSSYYAFSNLHSLLVPLASSDILPYFHHTLKALVELTRDLRGERIVFFVRRLHVDNMGRLRTPVHLGFHVCHPKRARGLCAWLAVPGRGRSRLAPFPRRLPRRSSSSSSSCCCCCLSLRLRSVAAQSGACLSV